MAAHRPLARPPNSPRDVRRDLALAPKQLRRSISTTRSARACSTRSAGCRGIASRAPRARLLRAPRAGRSSRALAETDGTIVELGLRQRREARAARRGAAAPRRLGARPPDRHLVAGARADASSALDAAAARLRSSATSRPTKRACARAVARARPRADARAAPRIEHRQLRSAGRAAFLDAHPRAAARPATCCCSAPISSSRSATAAGLRRSARRHRGLQPESAGPHQPRAGRRLRSARLRPPRGLERRASSRIEMHLVSARRPDGAHSRRRRRRSHFAAGESIWTESSYKYTPNRFVDMGAGRGFDARDSGSTTRRQFALTLFTAAELAPSLRRDTAPRLARRSLKLRAAESDKRHSAAPARWQTSWTPAVPGQSCS